MSERSVENNKNELYAIVSEFLESDQHILDQPPFTWARIDPNLVPNDFFVHDNSWYFFTKTVLGSRHAFMQTELNDYALKEFKSSVNKQKIINEEKYSFDDILAVGEKLFSELEFHYPYIVDYFRENERTYSFDLNPRKIGRWRVSTYAAYAVRKQVYEKAKDVRQWAGLAEELPSSFSLPEDVKEAMPAKSRANKKFRLIKAIGFES
ncbi:hypothetical protein IID21_02615 [Patescibacteria group bacterium]|nr:hypothetical protein [Patescibacteria group bacterium]